MQYSFLPLTYHNLFISHRKPGDWRISRRGCSWRFRNCRWRRKTWSLYWSRTKWVVIWDGRDLLRTSSLSCSPTTKCLSRVCPRWRVNPPTCRRSLPDLDLTLCRSPPSTPARCRVWRRSPGCQSQPRLPACHSTLTRWWKEAPVWPPCPAPWFPPVPANSATAAWICPVPTLYRTSLSHSDINLTYLFIFHIAMLYLLKV